MSVLASYVTLLLSICTVNNVYILEASVFFSPSLANTRHGKPESPRIPTSVSMVRGITNWKPRKRTSFSLDTQPARGNRTSQRGVSLWKPQIHTHTQTLLTNPCPQSFPNATTQRQGRRISWDTPAPLQRRSEPVCHESITPRRQPRSFWMPCGRRTNGEGKCSKHWRQRWGSVRRGRWRWRWRQRSEGRQRKIANKKEAEMRVKKEVCTKDVCEEESEGEEMWWWSEGMRRTQRGKGKRIWRRTKEDEYKNEERKNKKVKA